MRLLTVEMGMPLRSQSERKGEAETTAQMRRCQGSPMPGLSGQARTSGSEGLERMDGNGVSPTQTAADGTARR